jgi:hypothetical protein
MEAAACFAGFNTNGAWAPLTIARPAEWAIPALERRTIAGQADGAHGKAGRAYAARQLRAGRLLTGTDHEAESVPVTPRFAGD